MASESVSIRISETGSRIVQRSFDAIASSSSLADKAVKAFQGGISGVGSALGGVQGLASSAANRVKALGSSFTSMGSQASGAGRQITGLRLVLDALGGVLAYMSARTLMDYADKWTTVTGLIKTSTKTTEEAAAVQQELFNVSQRTGAGINDMAKLYSAAARAGTELGVSQQQVLQMTEVVGQALTVQGVSATEASGALLQLGQALAGGTVRSQEFNSILEGTPILLQVAAAHIDGANGSVAALRAQMNDGKLSSKELFDAIIAGSEDMAAKYGQVGTTFASTWTQLENAVIKFVGEMNNSVGIANTFGAVIGFIANNLDMLMIALGAVAAGVAVAFAPAAVVAFGRAVAGVFALIAAHPLAALVTALAAVVMWLVSVSDQINVGIDDITTLADVGSEAASMLGQAWDEFATYAGEGLSSLWDTATDVFDSIVEAVTGTTSDSESAFAKFFEGTDSGFMGLLQKTARVMDLILGILNGLAIGATRTFTAIPGVIVQAFNQMYNKVISIIEATINTGVAGINRLRSMVGMSLVDTVALERKQITESETWKAAGANIANSMKDGFEGQGGFVEGLYKDLKAGAKLRAANRTVYGGGGGANLGASMGSGSSSLAEEAKKGAKGAKGRKPAGAKTGKTAAQKAAEQALKDAEKLKTAYDQLLGTVDPVAKATADLAKDQETLNKAYSAGLVSAEKYAEYTQSLKKHYADAIDPLSAYGVELQKEKELLKLSSEEMQIRAEVQGKVDELLEKGIRLTAGQAQAIEAEVRAIQKLNKEQQIRQSISQQADDLSGRTALQKTNILGGMLQNGEISKGDAQLVNNEQMGSMGLDISGTAEGLAQQKSQFEQYYTQLKAMRDADLIGEQTYSSMKMQIWNQENAAKLSGVQGMLGNLAQLQNSNSKKMARVGKAAAIANTVIETYKSATSAYASMAGIPYVGPALGVAAAAAAVAAGMANVAAIRKQNVAGYMNGGYTGNGGIGDIAGVVHGKEYVLDAQTTNRLGVDNLDSLRRGQMSLTPSNSNSSGGTNLNISFANYGTPQVYETEQISEEEIRIIARDEATTVVTRKASSVVAKDLVNANSEPSKALARHTTVERTLA